METYRVLWLSLCVPLGAIGAAVGLVVSPAAVAFLFIVVGAVGSLLRSALSTRTGSAAQEVGCGSWRAARWSREPASVPSSGSRPSWVRVSSCSQPGPGRLAYAVQRRRSLVQIGPHPLDRPAGRCGACL